MALGSITTNKASGGDGIPVELFQILRDDALKVLHSICQQIWKTQQGPQDWERSVFIPIPKKGNAKECSSEVTQLCLTPCTRLLCPWDFPGKNSGVDCHFLLQEIFLTRASNLSLPASQADSLPAEPPEKPQNKQ